MSVRANAELYIISLQKPLLILKDWVRKALIYFWTKD